MSRNPTLKEYIVLITKQNLFPYLKKKKKEEEKKTCSVFIEIIFIQKKKSL